MEKISGAKANKFLYRDPCDFLYYLNKSTAVKQYFTWHHAFCNGRANITLIDSAIKITKEHIHTVEQNDFAIIELRTNCVHLL